MDLFLLDSTDNKLVEVAPTIPTEVRLPLLMRLPVRKVVKAGKMVKEMSPIGATLPRKWVLGSTLWKFALFAVNVVPQTLDPMVVSHLKKKAAKRLPNKQPFWDKMAFKVQICELCEKITFIPFLPCTLKFNLSNKDVSFQ